MSINSHTEKNPCSIKDSIQSINKSKDFQSGLLSINDTIMQDPDLGATIPGQNKERWDVAKLPADLNTISKPSRRLEKYLREKEISHNGAVEKMNDELGKVNFDFEEDYRYSAELLKTFLQKEKDKVEDVVKETLYEPKNTIIFAALKYNDIPTAICNYSNFCREAIEKFYNCTLFLEKRRCDKYKKIFKRSYLEVYEISHFLPFQVQLFIELEINKFNEILLQNYRCYAEVDMILKSDIEQNKIMWHQKFNRNKTKWMDLFKSHGLSTNILQNISEVDVKSMMSVISVAIDDKYKEILDTITELDELVNEALRKCKYALLKIYYGEYNELHTLDDSFLVPTDAASQDQLKLFRNELKTVMQKVETEHLLENELDDTSFKYTIEKLRERIKQTDIFFSRVSQLWDAHYRREVELNDTVAEHINKNIAQNDDGIQGVEMQLNIYSDACRSAATMEKLQINFGYSMAALKKCVDLYSDQMLNEQQILTKYVDMVDTEADILVAEINRFLVVYDTAYEYPIPCETKESTQDLFADDRSMDSYVYVTDDGSESSVAAPPHIKYISFRITSLDNWKYGIWDTIEAKMRECKAEMLEKAKAWTEPYKNAIDLRYQRKLALNNIKLYRIWLTVYYIRYMELQQHHDRLDKHKKGMNSTIEDLLKCQTNILQEVSLLVEITAQGIYNLEQEVKYAKSKTYLQSADAKMKYLKETFRTDLDKLTKNSGAAKLKYERIVQQSNIEYLKNVLMFSESGNFHVDEVKFLTEELQGAEKDFLKKTANDEKDFLAEVQKISQKIGGLEMSLKNLSNYMRDEFDFLNNIRECMNALQNEIKKTAYNLKYKRKVVETYIEKVKELANNLTSKTTENTLAHFAAQCFEVVKNFEGLYFLLKRNDECDLLPNITKSMGNYTPKSEKSSNIDLMRDEEKRSRSSLIGRSSRSVSATRTNLSGTGLESGELNQESTSEIMPFNDDIVNLLCEKMERMRNFGLSFYTTVRSIINKDKIEATFEEFCGNIMAKCSYFQIQCDAMWLEEAIEYVNLSTIFRNGLVKTYKHFLNICQECNQLKYENRFANLQEMLDDVVVDAVIDIKKVHRKLKTLHGCPKNKELLDKLHDEFLEQLKKYDSTICRSIGNFKSDHKDLKQFLMGKLTAFDDILRELLSSDRLKNLNADMFVQILNLFTKLQNLKKTKSGMAISSGDQDKNTIISKIASEKFSIYKSSLVVIPIPEEYVTRFSVGNASIHIEPMSDTFSFDDDAVAGADLVAFSNEMDHILSNHLEGVDQYTARVRSDCENWQAIWENDVKIIKDLYTVKYAIPK